MRCALVLVLALTACGRFGFGAAGDAAAGAEEAGGDAPGDASTDAPAESGIDAPADPCKPTYRVCDGFETPSFGTHWMTFGNVTHDTTIAHRGTQSAHFRAMATAIGQDNYVDITDTTTLALGDPTLYVRAWVRTLSLPANNMGLLSANQVVSGAQESGMFLLPDALAVYSQFDNVSRDNGTLPPTNTWFCVIWQITRATTSTGTLAISGDQPPATLSPVQTDGAPPVHDLEVGIQFAGSSVSLPQPGMEVWIDDVIVSPSPVTCAD